LKHILLKTVY